MSMPNVSIIDEEASILSKLANDLDNFRRYYSFREEHPDESILIQFVAPKIVAYEDYRFCLLQNSETKLLSPSRYYRPDYVSYDEYGTINLWALLMFVNDVPTLEDFVLENILIPTKKVIIEISNDILKQNLKSELVPLSEYPPKPTPMLFTRQKSIPRYATQEKETPLFTPTNMYFMRQQYTVDVVMARERYIDLTYEPVAESVVLKVKDSPNYLYDKHYTLVKGTRGYNRLTWDPRKLTKGLGMMSVLVEGTQFEVSYARKVAITT